MKFSEKWLREYVDPPLSSQELVDQLTMAGLEVDGVEPAAASFTQVLVGEIRSIAQHPDADKLVVCQVDNGQETLQVVCGAPNARAGIKVPFAQVGAVFPDLKIKKAKLRGVESFGMLCSERELGISESHEGLMELPADAPVGMDIVEYLSLDDQIIEVDLTPNRSDCLSVIGLARETGLMNQLDVRAFEQEPVPQKIDDTFPVELAAGDACPRFVGRVIRGINQQAESPLWMKEKLRRAGLRAIDPVVDVTNFVMLELGQPLHAYDLDRLAGKITVRQSTRGESVTLLDNSEIETHENTLLITDESGPIGLAGVMGGLSTAVTASTVNVFLEGAFFHPTAIAGRARSYGMSTDAAHRFERGVDWQGQMRAIERATALLLEISGGEAGPLTETVNHALLPEIPSVTLRLSRISLLLGVRIDHKMVDDILSRLGFEAVRHDSGDDVVWDVTAPSHRFDIEIEADLIEEVSRVFGYNNLPTRTPETSLRMTPKSESRLSLDRIKDQLVSRGYFEAVTYSFVDARVQTLLDPENEPLELTNPLSSEMSLMRTSLWTGLLNSLNYNLNRQQQRVRLFECGLCFTQRPNQAGLTFEDISQVRKIAGVICGPRQGENWTNDTQPVDFFDIKGDLESLLRMTGEPGSFEFRTASHPALHSGQCASVLRDGQPIGYVGRLHPRVQTALEIRKPVFVFEIDVDRLLAAGLAQHQELSRYPEVRRDIALSVDERIQAADLTRYIRQEAGEFLTDVSIFDVYTGDGVADGEKSLAIGLSFQTVSRTLTEEEVSDAVNHLIEGLGREFAARLR